MITGIRNFRLY